MGVKGLWHLLQPIGTPVNLDGLEGHILAIDVSIWLNQCVKGFRDKRGHSVHNAHVLGLFTRICKLLFYKIKPVFVFDGSVPELKKKTIALRNSRRYKSIQKGEANARKKLLRYISSLAKQSVDSGIEAGNFKLVSTRQIPFLDDDLFDLPASEAEEEEEEAEEDGDSAFTRQVEERLSEFQDLEKLDVESESFKSLPPEIRHELLTFKKEQRKGWARIGDLPSDSNEFSSYQMGRLLHKRELQQNIEKIEEEMKNNNQEEFLFDSMPWCSSHSFKYNSKRLASDATSHVIYVQKNSNTQHKNPQRLSAVGSSKNLDNIFTDVSQFDYGKEEAIRNDNSSHMQVASQNKSFSSLKTTKIIRRNLSCDVKSCTLSSASNFESNPNSDRLSPKALEVDNVIPEPSCSKSDDFHRSTRTTTAEIAEDDDDISTESFDSFEVVAEIPAESLVPHNEDHEEKQIGEKSNCEVSVVAASKNNLLSQDTSPSSITSATSSPHKTPQKDSSEVFTKLREAAKTTPIKEKRERLQQELYTLERDIGRQERHANTVVESMVTDCQELLRLFGIPYVMSPMEAEAQCAFLEDAGLTQGTITDDSDIWLFGAKTVYKNFFAQSKFVELYKLENIEKELKLSREKMICIALLTGSDYTEGVEGIGIVKAIEILSEFNENGFESLESFKRWWISKRQSKDKSPGNKTRAKFIKLALNETFPNKVVFDAYANPTVDDSRDRFQWGVPDLDLLRKYALNQFKWNVAKVDGVLLPVIKRFNEKRVQKRIDDYFTCDRRSGQIASSKRLATAFDKLGSKEHSSQKETHKVMNTASQKNKALQESSVKQSVKNQRTKSRIQKTAESKAKNTKGDQKVLTDFFSQEKRSKSTKTVVNLSESSSTETE